MKTMGIFNPTSIVEDLRKSVGNQTFYLLKGQNVARKKQAGRTDAPSEEQRKQRARFAAGADLQWLFAEAAEKGLPSHPRQMTAQNYFSSLNLNEGVIEVSETLAPTFNFDQVVCAKGRVRLPENISVTYDEGSNALSFTMGAEEDGVHRQATDEAYAFVVETKKFDSRLVPLGARGDGGTASFELKTGWDAANLAVYLFAVSADGKKASNSQYGTVA